MHRHTQVQIHGEQFFINGQPTYPGRSWNGHRIEGLLFNARLVQGIFDDLNPETRPLWVYPDTGVWDAERNTREFIAAMPLWRAAGMLAFTINLQGGSPQGYSQAQPWFNSAVAADGSLRPDYMARLEPILDRADELGMVVILGLFYFGQDERIRDETAVIRAVDDTLDWLFAREYRHVLIEITNESDIAYEHPILQPGRVHELIQRVQQQTRDGWTYPASTSLSGCKIPPAAVISTADFVLLHGNGADDPATIRQMVRDVRSVAGYQPKPVMFNEDDHYDFDQPDNNLIAAISAYASWGYFDYRRAGEGFEAGYQSVPVDWGINADRKRSFFNALRVITGG